MILQQNSIHSFHSGFRIYKGQQQKKNAAFSSSDVCNSKSVTEVKLTIVSMSGRFLKTKSYQNHEQNTRPEEFSQGEDLEICPKKLVFE